MSGLRPHVPLRRGAGSHESTGQVTFVRTTRGRAFRRCRIGPASTPVAAAGGLTLCWFVPLPLWTDSRRVTHHRRPSATMGWSGLRFPSPLIPAVAFRHIPAVRPICCLPPHRRVPRLGGRDRWTYKSLIVCQTTARTAPETHRRIAPDRTLDITYFLILLGIFHVTRTGNVRPPPLRAFSGTLFATNCGGHHNGAGT